MLIKKMSLQECRDLLARVGFGRLACARENQPYIVPIYFAYEPDHLYGFSTMGHKIEWMRLNPFVCMQADEILNPHNWASVIVLGRYEELPDTPEYVKERNQAQSLLGKRSLWWQPGYAASQARGRRKPASPVLYCIRVDEITGLRASPDQVESVIDRASRPRRPC
jgi:nitroimidazol reductase NimA-like FMN-containing flavoprotein (pyridoxamine 5'-phosphate oxidase superfamily)